MEPITVIEKMRSPHVLAFWIPITDKQLGFWVNLQYRPIRSVKSFHVGREMTSIFRSVAASVDIERDLGRRYT